MRCLVSRSSTSHLLHSCCIYVPSTPLSLRRSCCAVPVAVFSLSIHVPIFVSHLQLCLSVPCLSYQLSFGTAFVSSRISQLCVSFMSPLLVVSSFYWDSCFFGPSLNFLVASWASQVTEDTCESIHFRLFHYHAVFASASWHGKTHPCS